MSDTVWLALQAGGTFVIVIFLAYLSRKQVRQMLASRWPRKPSAMARATPDPQFRPDPEVTDPFHVTDAHHEPASGDRSGAGPTAGQPAERPAGAGSPRGHEQMVDRARTASVEHPSAVEQLDGMVGPADGARRDDVGADATVRPREAP